MNMLTPKHFMAFLLLWSYVLCHGQDFRSLRFGEQSGIASQQFNPAYNANKKNAWDLNLFGLGLDISNNYFRFDKTSFLQFVNSRDEIIENIEMGIDDTDDIDSIFNIQYYNYKNTRAHIDAELAGPGILLNFKTFSIGVYSKLKIIAHMNDMPNWKDANVLADITYGIPYQFPTANFSMASWLEMGVNFSTSFETDEYSKIHLGVNLKNYKAYDLLYARSRDKTLSVKHVDSLYFEDARFDAAYFNGFDYDETSGSGSYTPSFHGNGYGLDLGFVYEFRNNYFEESDLSLGLSIIDLGFTNYYNGHYHHIDLNQGFIIKEKFLDEFFTTELTKDLDIDEKVYLERGVSKKIIMPMTINVFADYRLNQNILLNLAVRENIPGISPMQRSSFASFTGQYRTKWWSYTLPLSLYNHQFVHFGSAFKIGPLTIGSDNILPLFLPLDLKSANFYISMNINSAMFTWLEGFSRKKGSKKNRGKSLPSQRKVKCYEF